LQGPVQSALPFEDVDAELAGQPAQFELIAREVVGKAKKALMDTSDCPGGNAYQAPRWDYPQTIFSEFGPGINISKRWWAGRIGGKARFCDSPRAIVVRNVSRGPSQIARERGEREKKKALLLKIVPLGRTSLPLAQFIFITFSHTSTPYVVFRNLFG